MKFSMVSCVAAGSSDDTSSAEEEQTSNESPKQECAPKLLESHSPLLAGRKKHIMNQEKKGGVAAAADDLIYSFVSPLADKIYNEGNCKGLAKRTKNRQTERNLLNKEEKLDNSDELDISLEASEHHHLEGTEYRELTIHIYQSIDYLQSDAQIPIHEVEKRMVDVVFKKPHMTKLLVFDLDETLSHCLKLKQPQRKPDVYLDIKLANGSLQKFAFNMRPYTKEILQLANQHYEVAVFTASTQVYADTVIDWIDPTGEFIQHRYYRDTCIKIPEGGVFVKDLRVFKNIDLKNILLVDNAAYSFGEQLDNGIPITSFMEDVNDKEFLYLMKYLKQVAHVDDLRQANRQAFRLHDIYDYKLRPFIHFYDAEECEEELQKEEEENEQLNSSYSAESWDRYQQHLNLHPSSLQNGSGTGSSHDRSLSVKRKRKHKVLKSSLIEPLDYFAKIMKKNKGKLI